MNNQSSNNLIWINHIKCLCMILVYLYHTEAYYNCPLGVITNLYEPFFVNLFFIVSGYLLFRKYKSVPNVISPKINTELNSRNYYSNIFYRLFIPTIIFSLINYFPKKILRGQPIEIDSMLLDSLGGGSLWFTSALVVAQVLIFIGLVYIKSRKIVSFLFYSIALSIIANVLASDSILNSTTFPWYYKAGMHAVLFMTIGGLYWRYESKIDNFIIRYKWLTYIAVLGYIMIAFNYNDYLEYNISTGKLNIYGFICAVISSLFVISITKKIAENSFTEFVGRNSIGFYFLSGGIPNVISVIALKFSFHSTALTFVLTAISFLIAFFIVKILTKWFYFLFDLRKL